jgi:hypothetical protein
MLRDACVTSLHEAESFTGILPLIRLFCQCMRLLIYLKCNQTEINRELLVKKYVQWAVSKGRH